MRTHAIGNTSGYQQFKYRTIQPNKLKGRQTGSGTGHDRTARNHNSHMHRLPNAGKCTTAKHKREAREAGTFVQVWVSLSVYHVLSRTLFPYLPFPLFLFLWGKMRWGGGGGAVVMRRVAAVVCHFSRKLMRKKVDPVGFNDT